MAYHRFCFEDDFDMEDMEGKSLPGPTSACFSGVGYEYGAGSAGGKNLVVTLMLTDEVESLIEDINNTFKNIRVRIIHKKDTILYTTNWERLSHSYLFSGFTLKPGEKLLLYSITIDPVGEFNHKQMFWTYTPILQLIRTFSPCYQYTKYFKAMRGKGKTLQIFLDAWSKYSGCKTEYGNWCPVGISLSNLLLLDKPDFIKYLDENHTGRSAYMSSIVGCMKNYGSVDDLSDVKPEDIVEDLDGDDDEDHDEDHDDDDEDRMWCDQCDSPVYPDDYDFERDMCYGCSAEQYPDDND